MLKELIFSGNVTGRNTSFNPSPSGEKALGMVSGTKAYSIMTESVVVQPSGVAMATLYQPSAVTRMLFVVSPVFQV
jgi:hypothetical protein